MNDNKRFHVSLGAFNDKADANDLRREWEEWHRAFELLMQMENVESQSHKLISMLTLGGRGLQRIFYNLRPIAGEVNPAPVKVPLIPQDVPEYDNAVKRLRAFFMGKRNERVDLEVFRSLKQMPDESFNNFMLRLRDQAARCEFSTREETELLQQITIGARDEKVRDKGLENVMSLDEVMVYAMNREILQQQREKHKPFLDDSSVNRVNSNRRDTSRPNERNHPYERRQSPRREYSSGQRSYGDCKRCGSSRHSEHSQECFARNARCNNCGERGHYARKCASKKAQQTNRFSGREPRREFNRDFSRRFGREANSVRAPQSWEEEDLHRPAKNENSKVV